MKKQIEIEEPRLAKWLFTSSQGAVVWLVVRLYFGYEWAKAGWEKVIGSGGESWITDGGKSLKGFAGYALTNAAQGEHSAVNYGWYAAFLRWIERSGAPVLGPIIAVGELMIGVALIVGLFTGAAAFCAGMLSMSFGLAGVAGVNPLFFLAEVLLILAWRNAGYYGLDRYVLPAVGTPWHRGTLFRHEPSEAVAA